MTDAEIISALQTKCGGAKAFAAILKKTRQAVWNWQENGLSPEGRLAIYQYARSIKFTLPADFLTRDSMIHPSTH